MLLVLLNYSILLHKQIPENCLRFSLRDDHNISTPLPLPNLFLLVISGWTLLISDSACFHLTDFYDMNIQESRTKVLSFSWHYERIKIPDSKLPLKISVVTHAWKHQTQQIFLITSVRSVVQ